MENYDIIIIGAGPAGLNAAKFLGEAGKKVLILEKNAEIGPKICAGGLTRKSIKYLNLPEELIDYKYNEIIFNSPRFRSTINFNQIFFYTIDRKKLGAWQLEKLNGNVTVRTKTHVGKIEKDHIVVNGQERIGYSYLIGADGSNSVVRRYLKIGTLFAGVAIQYKLPIGRYKDFEIFMDSGFFGAWYSWIFPHHDHISIGYGYPQKVFSPLKAQKKFEKWCSKLNIDFNGAQREAFMINADYRGFKFNNVFLAGDAAGMPSSFTGEGIYQALVSGEEIAKIILDKKHRPKKIWAALVEKRVHEAMLVIVIAFWPVRNLLFDLITLAVRVKLLGRTLIRILT